MSDVSPPPIWLRLIPSALRQRLEGRHALQKIIGNIGWLFFDRAVRMVGGLFVGIWIARYLGPPQFGLFSYAIAFVSLFGALASLGLDGVVVRELVRHPDRRLEILGTALSLKLYAGTAAFITATSSMLLLHPKDAETLTLVSIISLGLVFQAFDTIDLWFQSQTQAKFAVFAKNVAFVLLAFGKIGLILMGANLTAFAWAALAEVVIGAIGLCFVFFWRGFGVQSLRFSGALAKTMLGESWPFLLSGLAIMLYMRIDQIMLAEMVGNREVGVYSAALRLSELWYVVPVVIVSSVSPWLTEARMVSRNLYRERLYQLLKWLAMIAYLIALPMTFLSSSIMPFLYGQQYSSAGMVLAIHIWAALFVFLGVGCSSWMINERLGPLALIQTVMGAVLNIVLNYILIPEYGAVGCAIATTLSYAVAAWLGNALFKETREIFYLQTKAILLRAR